jgi:hypothetical protein
MWPGKAFTSSTITVLPSRAAAPHTPRSNGIQRHPIVPWYGPTSSIRSATRR